MPIINTNIAETINITENGQYDVAKYTTANVNTPAAPSNPFPVIDTLNVTPTTSEQQITAPQGTDGYSPVNVSAVTSSIDANIVAGNIKNGVTILGVTGDYAGQTPTGTTQITSNGTHNVAGYEFADVQVPTTAPVNYINFDVDADGVLKKASPVLKFEGAKDIDTYALYYAYANDTNVSGDVVATSLEKCSQDYACRYAFMKCTGITSVDFRKLKTVTGTYTLHYAFQDCTGITSVNLGSLTTVSGSNGCGYMFKGCTGLTSVDLSSLTTVSGSSGCAYMFKDCSGITSVDLSSLTSISGSSGCANMFNGCTNLASINISKLAKLGISSNIAYMFRNTSLTELRFPNLAYTNTNINSAFNNTLQGVTGCTVHFPSDWQADMANYSNITNGLGGTNTTVLFDLPAVTTFDFSYITEIETDLFAGFALNYIFPNVTKVDLSSLTTVSGSGSCSSMFKGCTGLTSVDLSSLTTISSYNGCTNMFNGCTGITSVDLSSLTTISGDWACEKMFSGCTGITSVDFSSLTTITGGGGCKDMFEGCTGITELRFPSLTTLRDYTVVSGMLYGTTGVTVHFPSNLSSYQFEYILGGTNTTVLYDLPATE